MQIYIQIITAKDRNMHLWDHIGINILLFPVMERMWNAHYVPTCTTNVGEVKYLAFLSYKQEYIIVPQRNLSHNKENMSFCWHQLPMSSRRSTAFQVEHFCVPCNIPCSFEQIRGNWYKETHYKCSPT